MCVIAIKQKGLKMIPDDTIKAMFKTNPHGAGIMYLKKDGKVHIEKGFFQVEKLLRYLHDKEKVLENTDVILHFRIATSGKTDQLGCHPYSVWSNNTSISANVEMGMAHNGVLDGNGWKGNNEINDTQMFIKDLKSLPHNFLSNKTICKLIANSIGTNRLAFLDANGIHTFGTFIKDGDYWYSNENFKPRQYYFDTSVSKPVTKFEVKYPSGTKKKTKATTVKSVYDGDEDLFQESLFGEGKKVSQLYLEDTLNELFIYDNVCTFEDMRYSDYLDIKELIENNLRSTVTEDGEEVFYDNDYAYIWIEGDILGADHLKRVPLSDL